MESSEDQLAILLADCIKTMQEVKFICERAQTFNIEKEAIDDILELLKKKVWYNQITYFAKGKPNMEFTEKEREYLLKVLEEKTW